MIPRQPVPASPEMVYAALVRAVQSDGPVRLVEPSGEHCGAGLFPAAGSQAAIQEAVPQFLQEDPRASNQPRFVRLTASGLEQLLEWSLPEDRAPLVLAASPLYQKTLFARWSILIHRHGWNKDRKSWAQCGARLAADFVAAESPGPPLMESGLADVAPLPVMTDAAADFQRSLAHELTISWKHAEHPEAREGIARAMRSAGLRQLGETGEQVTFAGRYHVSTAPMFPGDAGFIVEPGWLIHDGSGEYLLEKALVAPV